MHCKIWTLKDILYDGSITSITYPNITLGPTTILKDHIPTIGYLKKGIVTYITENETRTLDVDKGIIHVEKNQVTVILLSI